MNYFELHIGDYEQATAHLTACEDGIYGRLIRWYMAGETALPADQKLIQRRIRARSKDEQEAVATVLEEFFELRADGWHQQRCDEEIARYKDKQAKAKRSADARWSAHRSDSEGNANASSAGDADDMRTHSEGNAPRARPQTPDTKHQPSSRATGTRAVALVRPDGVSEQVWADWLQLRKAKKAPVTGTVLQGAEREAAKAGMPLEAFLRVWCTRGSQGLQADWLRPEERGAPALSVETMRQRAARERMEAFAPGVAAKAPQAQLQQPAHQQEIFDVTPRRLDR